MNQTPCLKFGTSLNLELKGRAEPSILGGVCYFIFFQSLNLTKFSTVAFYLSDHKNITFVW